MAEGRMGCQAVVMRLPAPGKSFTQSIFAQRCDGQSGKYESGMDMIGIDWVCPLVSLVCTVSDRSTS